MALNPAVFIDKDGTLVHDVPYNVDPARVRLRDDAGPALARLQRHGYRLILITNQPGIALGRFAPDALDAVWSKIATDLSAFGVVLDAIYHCPHHPQGSDARYGFPCDCRKPKPGLLLRAAREHRLALRNSWMIGDILDDVEAGRSAGCRTVLLDVGSETEWRRAPMREPDVTVTSIGAAADAILADASASAPQGWSVWAA